MGPAVNWASPRCLIGSGSGDFLRTRDLDNLKLFFAVSQVGPDQFFIVFAASVTVYDKAAQGNHIMQKK